MRRLTFFLSLLFIWGVCIPANAQGDSVGQLRALSNACNVYRQLPVTLLIGVESSSNVVESKDDTANVKINCFIDSLSSYVSYGDMEQLASDSLMLLISQKSRRMVLYRYSKKAAKQRLQSLTGAFYDDSLIRKTLYKYRFSFSKRGDTISAVLTSRDSFVGTAIAKDSVVIRYSDNQQQLIDIRKIHRSLIRLEMNEYADLQKNAAYSNTLIAKGDSSYFLIRTKQTIYRYLGVWHDKKDVPAKVLDRVAADVNGDFRPVSQYSDYILTKGN